MISDKTVAMTILEQLGGLGRLKAMIGIKNVTYTVNSVSFCFMKGRGGVNAARIVLNARDYYDVEYLKIRGINVTSIAKDTDIDCENLKPSFERKTGLALSF